MLTRNVAAQNKILKDCIAPLIDLKNHVIKRREASSGYLGKMMAFWTSKEYLRKSELAQKRVQSAIDALSLRVAVRAESSSCAAC